MGAMDNTIDDIGSWKKLRLLGSGGFGQVTLWYNFITGQKLAIKRLHEHALKDITIKNKLIERWCNEVEIMKKLNHTNIVSTLEIPPDLCNITSLPVLAMEYCSEGDLRQVLNKAENCNGLREPEILDILRDVSNGLAYLHSCKIIHRDLKPDNIVLQQKDSRIVYKLIDLGYAKAFDQSSLSKSFVGTIQYIAPELFMGKAYTSSVDYWSFGLLAHEIITGYRPFLPDYSPSDWMKKIQNKERNIVCVLQNDSGDLVFSSSISRKNHLSRCFLEDMEKWLQLALDWDGQTRGRDLNKNRPVIFESLGKIICKKIINVFSLPTYETIPYEVTTDTDILDLRRWLENDTGLEVEHQLLLLPNGKPVHMKGNLLNCLKTEELDRKNILIFLYNCGVIEIKSKATTKQFFVNELIKSSEKPLTVRQLKKSCANSVYFLQCEAMRHRNLLQGIRVKINNTKQKTFAIETLYGDIENEWNQIESFSQFLSISHKIDLENYIYYRKAGKLKSSMLVQKWIQNVIHVNNKITELRNSYNKSEQKQLVLLARQRCRNLDDHPGNEVVQKTPLDEMVIKGQKLWENIQKLPKDDRETLRSNASAANLLKRSTEESNKFLNSQMLKSFFLKISEADDNLAKFLSHLTIVMKSLKILNLLIENTQKERQKEVWSLIENPKVYENTEPANEKSKIVDELSFETPEMDKNEKSQIPLFPAKPDFDFSLKLCFENGLKALDSQETSSVIADNNHLRYRMQEAQQTCLQMIEEIGSLKWDIAYD